MIERLGKAAKMPFRVHPHMPRHACGRKLANDGHDTRRYGPKNDGTYIVEFRTAAGEALAISIPRTDAALVQYCTEP
jgi:hypothetical protein